MFLIHGSGSYKNLVLILPEIVLFHRPRRHQFRQSIGRKSRLMRGDKYFLIQLKNIEPDFYFEYKGLESNYIDKVRSRPEVLKNQEGYFLHNLMI